MKKLITLILAIALVAAAVFAIKHKKQQLAQIPPAKQYPIVVKTDTLKTKDGQLTHPYLALVQSDQDVSIGSNIGGRILYIAKVGQSVKTGDKLITIDSASLRSKEKATQLKIKGLEAKQVALESKLNSLKETHQRTKALLDVQGASIEQYQKEADAIKEIQANIDGLRSQIAGLEASLEAIKQQLTYANVTSPVDGTVSSVNITEGSLAMPGKPLITLSTKGGKYLLVRLANSDAKYAEYNGHLCPLNPLNHTFRGMEEYTCHVPVNKATGSLVDINLVSYRGKGLYVPLDGVLNLNGHNYLLEVAGNQAKKHPVQVLASGVEGYAIQGAQAGTEYVIAKPDILLKLTAGHALKPMPAK